jgi:hypothetical protein
MGPSVVIGGRGWERRVRLAPAPGTLYWRGLESGGKRNLKAFCLLSGRVGSRGYKTFPREGVGRPGKGLERRQVTPLSRGTRVPFEAQLKRRKKTGKWESFLASPSQRFDLQGRVPSCERGKQPLVRPRRGGNFVRC